MANCLVGALNQATRWIRETRRLPSAPRTFHETAATLVKARDSLYEAFSFMSDVGLHYLACPHCGQGVDQRNASGGRRNEAAYDDD